MEAGYKIDYWDECEKLNSSNNFDGNFYGNNRMSLLAELPSSSLRVAAILDNDYDIAYTITNGSLRFSGGYFYEILKYLVDFYSVYIIALNGTAYAATAANSTQRDIGTMLVNDECDVAGSHHEFNEVRLSKFSYLHSNTETRLLGYFVQPAGNSVRDIYRSVFKNELWMAILLTWIFIVYTIYFFLLVKKIMSLTNYENKSFVDIFFWVLGAACQNGEDIRANSTSLKIVVTCASLTGLFIYLTYSAAIYSVFEMDTVPIKDKWDMISSKFTFYADIKYTGPIIQRFFNELGNTDARYKNGGHRFRLSASNAFNKSLTTSHVAYVTLGAELRKYIDFEFPENLLCTKLSTISFDGHLNHEAMMVKRGSPWKEYLNRKLLWAINNGILYRLRERHNKQTTIMCPLQYKQRNEELGFKDVFTAFCILIIIYAFSLLCFAAENIIATRYGYRRSKRRDNLYLSPTI